MQLLILSRTAGAAQALLPALELLDHTIATAELVPSARAASARCDIVLLDATSDLAAAAAACRALASESTPILVVVSNGSLAALKGSWGFDDWILSDATPGEIETRLRLLAERATLSAVGAAASIGELHIDEQTYIVRLKGRPLDLTFREFELLKYLANNPGRVFTRGQLLREVWGYDYYGGTRTVDVHIRRLRAKLGAEYDQVIGTVRGVGYKLDPQLPGTP